GPPRRRVPEPGPVPPPPERRGAAGGPPLPPPPPAPDAKPADGPLSPTRRLLVAVQRRQHTLVVAGGVAALCFVVTLGGLGWRQTQLARQEALARGVKPVETTGGPASDSRPTPGEPPATTPATPAKPDDGASAPKEPEKTTDVLTSPKAE